MGFGKPKYGSGGQRNTWSIQKGDNFIRILPPMHSLAEEGRWAVYETMHWGYAGVDGKDQNKTKARPFRCIREEDRRTNMVLQECPECTLIEQYKAQEKEVEARLRSEGKTDEEVQAGLAPIQGWLKAHRPDAKWYIAVKKGDDFGQFKIPHRMKKQIEEIIQKVLTEDGIDALDLDQGLVFNIKRTGDGFSVPDTVELVMEDVVVNGRKLKQIKVEPITEEQANKALEKIEDLSKAGGLRLTYEQIKALTECSGDPEEVDQIIGKKGSAEASAPAAGAKTTNNTRVATPPANDNSKAKAAANDNAKGAQDPAIQKRLADLQAKQAAAAKAKAEAEARAKAEAEAAAAAAAESEGSSEEDPLGMSDEAFLAKFGETAQANG
jgi:hypothetical protein